MVKTRTAKANGNKVNVNKVKVNKAAVIPGIGVPGHIQLLTTVGYSPIEEWCGAKAQIWDGWNWVHVTPVRTGQAVPAYRVSLLGAPVFWCTGNHEWILFEGERKRTNKLKPGDKLMKASYSRTIGCERIDDPYHDGFIFGQRCLTEPLDMSHVAPYLLFDQRVAWLAGFIDRRGFISVKGTTKTLQFRLAGSQVSTWLFMMLTTMGVCPTLSYGAAGSHRSTVTLSTSEVQKLLGLGLTTQELDLDLFNVLVQPDRRRHVVVHDIQQVGDFPATYSFENPITQTAVFNGVLTGVTCHET